MIYFYRILSGYRLFYDALQCLHTLTGHTGGVWSSQMSECGSFIVSGSTDRTVRVWDVATGRCLHNLQGHTSTVRCMALKGKMFVAVEYTCCFFLFFSCYFVEFLK